MGFLVLGEKMTLRDALNLVKTSRPLVEVMPNYARMLIELDFKVHGSHSITESEMDVIMRSDGTQ
jgi:hypothetical protein